jgi:hypothetical protein
MLVGTGQADHVKVQIGIDEDNTAKKDIRGPYHSLNNFVYLLKIQGKI